MSGAPKIAEIGEDTQAYCDEPMNGEPLCQQRVGNVLDALLDDDCEATQVYREFPDEKDAEEESQQEDLGSAVPESSGGFQCGDPSAECVAESQDVELPRVVLDMFSGQSTESGEPFADGDWFVL